MIALELHGSFFLNKNLMLALLYLISTQWLKTNLGLKQKKFKTVNTRDYLNQILSPYFQSQGIYLTQPEPYFFKGMLLSPTGGKLFLLPHTL